MCGLFLKIAGWFFYVQFPFGSVAIWVNSSNKLFDSCCCKLRVLDLEYSAQILGSFSNVLKSKYNFGENLGRSPVCVENRWLFGLENSRRWQWGPDGLDRHCHSATSFGWMVSWLWKHCPRLDSRTNWISMFGGTSWRTQRSDWTHNDYQHYFQCIWYTNYSWVIRCKTMNYFGHMWYHFFPVIPRFDGSKAAKTQHIRSHITSSTWQTMKPVRTEVCWEMSQFLGLIHPYKAGDLVSCCISGNGKLPSFRGTGFLAIIGLSGVMHCHPKLNMFHFKVCFGWQYRDLRWFVPFGKVLFENKHGRYWLLGWQAGHCFFGCAWWKSAVCGDFLAWQTWSWNMFKQIH